MREDAPTVVSPPVWSPPRPIRSVSTRYVGYLPDYDFDTFDYMTCCDMAMCPSRTVVMSSALPPCARELGRYWTQAVCPLPSVETTPSPIRLSANCCKRHKKRVGVLHFDAHLDTMPSFGDDLYSRCSPFNRLYGDENFDSTKIVHIGIRGPRITIRSGIEPGRPGPR